MVVRSKNPKSKYPSRKSKTGHLIPRLASLPRVTTDIPIIPLNTPHFFHHCHTSLYIHHHRPLTLCLPFSLSIIAGLPTKRLIMAVSFRFTLFCVLFVLLTDGISAAHSAPGPAVDCSTLVTNMVDCLSFVTEGGTAKKPEGTCCSGLKTVLKTNADCLCETFKNSAQLGVTLNVTKALTLPAACHLSAPSISNCALNVAPGAAPALSPMAISPSSVVGAPTAGIGSNEGAPAPTPGSSGSSVLTASIELLVLTTAFLALF